MTTGLVMRSDSHTLLRFPFFTINRSNNLIGKVGASEIKIAR